MEKCLKTFIVFEEKLDCARQKIVEKILKSYFKKYLTVYF